MLANFMTLLLFKKRVENVDCEAQQTLVELSVHNERLHIMEKCNAI